MRKNLYRLSAPLAAAALATAAHAAVTASLINAGTPVPSSLSPTPMTGWTAYILRLESDSGNIQAFDFGAQNTGAITNAQGLAQRWGYDSDNEIITSSPLAIQKNTAANNLNVDSHFLSDNAQWLIATYPTEDFSGGGFDSPYAALSSPTGNSYGTGTFLKGAFGISAALQSTTVDVAYLVVPLGSTPGFTNAQVATPGRTFTISLNPIPEPASLALLSPLLLTRRRPPKRISLH